MCRSKVAAETQLLFDEVEAKAKQILNHGRTAVGAEFFLQEMLKLDMQKMDSAKSQKSVSDIEAQMAVVRDAVGDK